MAWGGPMIGASLLQACELHRVSTPALIVDEAAMATNISTMADFARRAGVALRPHAKTHKSSHIAKMQVEAGAVGVSCATVLEAEALSQSGIEDLMLTSPVADVERAERIASLNRSTRIAVVVDHPSQVEWLSAAVGVGNRVLNVLVDVDLGQFRTGVTQLQDAIALASKIAEKPNLSFCGLQGFGGHIQHSVKVIEREEAALAAAGYLRQIRDELLRNGLRCDVISGSGTGSYAFDARGPYTELQVGSYLFMDADYRRLEPAANAEASFLPSLFVLATIVSANRSGQVTIDAGVKSLALNGPPPDILVGVPAGSRYQFAGDEHGIVHLPPDSRLPDLGSRILVAATHCDPTVNNFSSYVFVGASGELKRIPIEGRY
jgi:D-serine deaminase-like pyridoxal phosphate-dependent protein